MSVSSDPTFSTTQTLLESLQRDLRMVSAAETKQEADRWAREGLNTVCELQRRAIKFKWS